jgi:hypothetical protein
VEYLALVKVQVKGPVLGQEPVKPNEPLPQGFDVVGSNKMVVVGMALLPRLKRGIRRERRVNVNQSDVAIYFRFTCEGREDAQIVSVVEAVVA